MSPVSYAQDLGISYNPPLGLNAFGFSSTIEVRPNIMRRGVAAK